jgi:hypothetical protein
VNIDLARIAELAAHALAAFTAYRYTRAGAAVFLPGAKPAYLFLLGSLVVDLVRWAIQACVLARSARPFTSMPRLLFHVDQAGFVAWSAGLVLLTLVVFQPRSRAASRGWEAAFVGCSWAGVLGVLVGTYPELRGKALGHVYTVLHVASVAVTLLVIMRTWRTGAWFNTARRVTTVLVVGDAATIFGPYLGEPFAYWSTAQAISTGVYLLLVWELRAARLSLS